MTETDRFTLLETQRHTLLQPECPIYVHCSRRCVARSTGAVFLQVRMVNCGEREIRTVFLCVEGLNAQGETLYTMRELILPDCGAKPHSVFGERQMLALERTKVCALRITVERVVFTDGMLWRRLPTHRVTTVQEAGWRFCTCGMPNPPERERCGLCRKPLSAPQEGPALVSEAMPEQPLLLPEELTPLFGPQISEQPLPAMEDLSPEQEDETDEDSGAPNWLIILACILGVGAMLALVGFLLFYLRYFFP